MTQIATILRKDLERLWPVCLIVIALIGFHLYGMIWLGPRTGVVFSGPLSILLLIASLSGSLLPVALVVILVLVIQEEPLVGSNAFWLTRPYARTALMAEKGLFMGLSALIPVIIHDLLALRWFGMASLSAAPVIIMKDFELACLLVCAATFAVLTAAFGRFTLLVMGGSVVFALLVLATNNAGSNNWGVLSGVSGVLAWSVAIIGATIVTVHQYLTRRVMISGIIGAVSLILAAVVLSYLPWTAAWSLKNWFGIPSASLPEVQLIPTPDASGTILQYDPASAQNLAFRTILYPFQIGNLPNDVSLEAFRSQIEIESASATPPLVMSAGAFFQHRPAQALGSVASPERQFVNLGILPDRDFERVRDLRVPIEGTMYFEAFRDLKPVRVPLSDRGVPIPVGRERCTVKTFPGLSPNGEKTMFVLLNCIELEPASGIRVDAFLVDAAGKPIWWRSTGSSGDQGSRGLLSALLTPVHQSTMQFQFSREAAVDPPSIPEDASVVISAREPIGLLRRDFRIDNVRLGDLEWTSWKQRGTKNYPASVAR